MRERLQATKICAKLVFEFKYYIQWQLFFCRISGTVEKLPPSMLKETGSNPGIGTFFVNYRRDVNSILLFILNKCQCILSRFDIKMIVHYSERVRGRLQATEICATLVFELRYTLTNGNVPLVASVAKWYNSHLLC